MLFADQSGPDPTDVARVKQAFRELFALPPETRLMVTELACHEPGHAPRETVLLALPEGLPTQQWKIHKAVSAIQPDDLLQRVQGTAGNADSSHEMVGCRQWRCPD